MTRIALCLLVLSTLATISIAAYNTDLITGFHFHTYFWQTNQNQRTDTYAFRNQTIWQAKYGVLQDCTVGMIHWGPVGPHLVGQWETCCNASAYAQAMSWFMQNREERVIFLHPLTKQQFIDHTDRSMFLGQRMPHDLDDFAGRHVLDDLPTCLTREAFLARDLN